jgi:hypothetical protein
MIDDIRLNADHRAMLAAEFEEVVKLTKVAREIFPTGDDTWPLPVNLKRLIWNARKVFHIADMARADRQRRGRRRGRPVGPVGVLARAVDRRAGDADDAE